MTELYILGAVLAIVIAGLFVVPLLTKKGIIDKGKLADVMKGIDISRLLIEVIKSEKLDKERANFILDVTDIALDYVTDLHDATENQKDIAISAVYATLDKIGVIATEAERKLIEILIDQALYYNK